MKPRMRVRGLMLALLTAMLGLLIGVTLALAEFAQANQGTTVAVVDAVTGYSDSQAVTGSVVTMRVSIQGAEDLAGAEFTLRYDNSVVQVATDGVAFGSLPEGWISLANVANSDGLTKLIVAGATPAGVDSITVAEIAFDVVGPSGSTTTLRLQDIVAGGAAEETLAVTPSHATISVVSAQVASPTPRPTSAPVSRRATASTPTPEPAPASNEVPAPEPQTETPVASDTATATLEPQAGTAVASDTPAATAEAVVALAEPEQDQGTDVQAPQADVTEQPTSPDPGVVTPPKEEEGSGSSCSFPLTMAGHGLTGAADLGLLGLLIGGLVIASKRRRY